MPKTRQINREELSQELSRLLTKPIGYHRIYAEVCGDVLAGVMLSQAIHWSNYTTEEDGSFFKTQEEWFDETALTRRNQETARKILKGLKDSEGQSFWIESLRGIPAKLYYRIDHKVLTKLMIETASNPKLFPKYANKIGGIVQTADSKGLLQIGGMRPTGLAESSQQARRDAPNYLHENTHENTHKSFLGDTHVPQTPSEGEYHKAATHLDDGLLFSIETQLATEQKIVDEELCLCGDRRFEHPDDRACRLNGLGHGMPSDAPENQCHNYRPVAEEYPPTPHAQGTGDDFEFQADFGAGKPASENGKARTGKQPKNALTTSAGSTSGIPQTDHARLMAAQVEITGQPILNGGALGKAIKTILGAYTVDQAIECLRWMAEPSTNWKGSVNWLAVQNYIGEYFRRQQQQQLKTNGGLNDKDVRGNLSRTKAETKADRSWITRQKWFRERFGDDAKVA